MLNQEYTEFVYLFVGWMLFFIHREFQPHFDDSHMEKNKKIISPSNLYTLFLYKNTQIYPSRMTLIQNSLHKHCVYLIFCTLSVLLLTHPLIMLNVWNGMFICQTVSVCGMWLYTYIGTACSCSYYYCLYTTSACTLYTHT